MDVVQRARDLKNSAMDERDLENWDGAVALLREGEGVLRGALADLARRDKDPELMAFETSVRKQLYHVLGSIGGVYRRKSSSSDGSSEDLDAAITAYDQGYAIEREFVDSYNLVQRLVSRVLLQPGDALSGSADVAGLNVRDALLEAHSALDSQTRDSGPRSKDEYAFADAAVVSVLLGEAGWADAATRFLRQAPKSSYARNVTFDVLGELASGAQPGDAATAALHGRIAEVLRLGAA